LISDRSDRAGEAARGETPFRRLECKERNKTSLGTKTKTSIIPEDAGNIFHSREYQMISEKRRKSLAYYGTPAARDIARQA
jgi:hypothetical protein